MNSFSHQPRMPPFTRIMLSVTLDTFTCSKRKYSEHKLGMMKWVWNVHWLHSFEQCLAEPCFTHSGAVVVPAGSSMQHREISGTTAGLCRTPPQCCMTPAGFHSFPFSKNFLLSLCHWSPSNFPSWHSSSRPLFSLVLPFCSLSMMLSVLLFIFIASWKNTLSGQEKEEPQCRSATLARVH